MNTEPREEQTPERHEHGEYESEADYATAEDADFEAEETYEEGTR